MSELDGTWLIKAAGNPGQIVVRRCITGLNFDDCSVFFHDTADATGVSASGAGVRLAGTEVRVEVTPAGPTQVDGDVFGPGALEARLRASLALLASWRFSRSRGVC